MFPGFLKEQSWSVPESFSPHHACFFTPHVTLHLTVRAGSHGSRHTGHVSSTVGPGSDFCKKRNGTGRERAPSTTGAWACGVWILEWVRPTQAACGDRDLQHLSELPRWPQVQAWLRRATDVGCRGLSYSLCLQGFQETALSEVDLTVFLQCLDLGIFFFNCGLNSTLQTTVCC